jgi:hypothetical protein
VYNEIQRGYVALSPGAPERNTGVNVHAGDTSRLPFDQQEFSFAR